MIARLREAGLPEPEFKQDGGMFVQTLWRDWLTADALTSLDLSERQHKAIVFLRARKRIANTEYQRLAGVTKATASRDLEALARLGVLRKVGTTGKGTHYTLGGKGLTKGSKGSFDGEATKGAQRAQTTQSKPTQAARTLSKKRPPQKI